VPGRLEREWVLWVELWLRAVRHPALQDVCHELYARLHEWFAGVIAEGVARGEFDVADVDATTDLPAGRDRRRRRARARDRSVAAARPRARARAGAGVA
jgi:transcriptional regulator BetI-like protein